MVKKLMLKYLFPKVMGKGLLLNYFLERVWKRDCWLVRHMKEKPKDILVKGLKKKELAYSQSP